MSSVPSFGVLARMTVGNVSPASVDREILTLAAETGAAELPATFQVTVRVEAACHLTAVLGAVTRNGPAAVVTVMLVCADAMPPPPARLSRAVTWKCITRLVDGRTSPVAQVPQLHTTGVTADAPV